MEKDQIILVNFLKPIAINSIFTDWPNHITIVPYFFTQKTKGFIKELKKVCKKTEKIKYRVGQIEYLGHKKSVKTSLVVSPLLDKFQKETLDLARKYCFGKNHTLTRSYYNPHITHHKKPYPSEGEEKEINEIYLIGKISQNSKQKKILEIFTL